MSIHCINHTTGWSSSPVFPNFVFGQGLLLRNTATAVTKTTVSGQVQDTDSVHTHVVLLNPRSLSWRAESIPQDQTVQQNRNHQDLPRSSLSSFGASRSSSQYSKFYNLQPSQARQSSQSFRQSFSQCSQSCQSKSKLVKSLILSSQAGKN